VATVENEFAVISTEKCTKTRTDSSLRELAPYMPDMCKLASSFRDAALYFVGYHSTPELEELARKYSHIHVLNPPYFLKEFLDQKTVVRQHLSKLGVNTIPGLEGKVREGMYDQLAERCGVPFVVQLEHSAGGMGTHLIDNSSEFHELAVGNQDRSAVFTKYIDGASLNMNAVRTRDFVILSEPSLQIIGQDACTTKRFGYCGNDFNFSSAVSEEHLEQMRAMTQTAGEWLGSIGYYGAFGVDFLADEKRVYFTELNPRFQGSTSLHVDRHIELGKIPISFFHLVPYLEGITIEPTFVEEYNRLPQPLNVSQMLLHNISGKDCTVESSLVPGRYIYEDDRLQYLGPAHLLSETQAYGEIVVTGEVPLEGTRVLKDSDELCRIFTYSSVLDAKGRNLNPAAKSLVDDVYKSFKFRYHDE
jgi:hypothetical protein